MRQIVRTIAYLTCAMLLTTAIVLCSYKPKVAAGSGYAGGVSTAGLPTITLTGPVTGSGSGGTIPTTVVGLPVLTPPTSWQQTAWYIDPQNTSGNASDSNACSTSAAPCRSYNGGVAAKWGTVSPRIRQNTVITFISSHTDDTDPFIFRPSVENQAQITITGTVTQVSTLLLGTVTAKNRTNGASSLLKSVLAGQDGGAIANGQMVINTTHPSVSWLFTNSGTTFTLMQPLTAATAGVLATPTEVDTWAANDAISLNSLANVDLVDIEPTLSDCTAPGSGTYTNVCPPAVSIYRVNPWDPNSSLADTLQINSAVSIYECGGGANVQTKGLYEAPSIVHTTTLVENVLIQNSVTLVNRPSNIFLFPNTPWAVVFGGYITALIGDGIAVDLDTDIGNFGRSDLKDSMLGLVYIGSGNLACSGICNAQASGSVSGGSNIIWGPGGLNVIGSGKVSYAAGSGKAASTFTLTTLQLNGQTKACLANPAASVTTFTCNLPVSASQADTSLGTTVAPGCLEAMGGQICNGAL